MKVLTILGARPQFIKASSVSRHFATNDNLKEIILHTGQHFDANMSDIFFDEMHIPTPDYQLGISGGTHANMTAKMMTGIEEILIKENPNLLMVYGDTNSTLAGSLAAAKLHINIAHVEAGLRSFNNAMPEEINRILTDRVSKLLFCPTQVAIDNLLSEGLEKWDSQAFLVGDVMQDGALYYADYARRPKEISEDNKFVLATIHRAENTDNRTHLKEIFEALNDLSESIEVIIPLHPRTKQKLTDLEIHHSENLKFIDPTGYLEMIWLIKNCEIVMTDSGGLQKEAFFFHKPCITMREETEWTELVTNNYNVLVGANKDKIITAYHDHIFSDNFDQNLYGSGSASSNIVKEIIRAS